MPDPSSSSRRPRSRSRRNRWAVLCLCPILLLVIVATGAAADEPVRYRLDYRAPGGAAQDGALVEVTLELPAPRPGPVALIVPRAIPSGYCERPYDRFIRSVAAFSATGEGLPVERAADGPRWILGKASQAVARVVYEVDLRAMEREVLFASDASKVRPGYVGVLGYSVFGFVEGTEQSPVRLAVSGPVGWPIVSTLTPAEPAARGHLEVEAADFYALADSQIVMGPKVSWRKIDGTVPLFVAIYAEGAVDAERVGRLAAEVMERVVAYFGGAPFSHYTVHMELLRPISERHEYGFSMEHLDSGTFFLAADRGITMQTDEGTLLRTRFNFAHHFAHSWIPKRSYGEGYRPFTWELAPLIDTVWLNEGFAWFAATEIIAGSMPAAEGAAFRQRRMERFRGTLAEAPRFIREMSMVELSRVASTRYGEDFRTGRNVFSRGALLAAEMDEAIRSATEGERSMRDVLRSLVAWSAEHRRPFRIDELPGIIQQASGVDVSEIFERWMQPLSPLPEP